MNKKSLVIVLLLIAAVFGAGLFAGSRLANHEGSAPPKEKERRVLFYRNPMNPNITSPTPTKDEMGMDYVPVYDGEEQGDGGAPMVTVAPEIANTLGVRTEPVTRSELARSIETVGYVGYDEHQLSHVHLRAEGWIEDLHVHAAGEKVKKGALLFHFYSPELVNAQEEFQQALNAKDERLIQLSRQRLAVLGVPRSVVDELEKGGKVQQRLPIYASQNGVVAELKVREGMFVERDMDVMTLADLASVWVIADVFEQQAAWVREGQRAEVRLGGLPDRLWQGRVEFIYPDVDPKTRTLRVRLRFENPGAELKPNMYATATIFAQPHTALSVPRDALIRTEHGARLILARGDGRFEPVDVKPGIESGDRVEILEGVQEGEKAVVSAQFLIDSEASLRAALRRMTPATSGETSPDKKMQVVQANGTVKGVDVKSHKITLSHDPITALGWPAMTMDFAVAPSVSLENVQPGTRIQFDLMQRDPTSYEIVAIRAAGGVR